MSTIIKILSNNSEFANYINKLKEKGFNPRDSIRYKLINDFLRSERLFREENKLVGTWRYIKEVFLDTRSAVLDDLNKLFQLRNQIEESANEIKEILKSLRDELAYEYNLTPSELSPAPIFSFIYAKQVL